MEIFTGRQHLGTLFSLPLSFVCLGRLDSNLSIVMILVGHGDIVSTTFACEAWVEIFARTILDFAGVLIAPIQKLHYDRPLSTFLLTGLHTVAASRI